MTGNGDRAWAEHVCHPVALAAVLALLLNDHLLKGAGLLPSAVTGKLSDFAGLFFFPALLAALVRGALRLGRKGPLDPRSLATASVAVTGAAFVALKLSPVFNRLVSSVWGPNVLDPTDLWALTALVPAWAWLRGPRSFPAWRGLELAAVALAGLASVATTPVKRVLRSEAVPAARNLGCAELGGPTLTLWTFGAEVQLDVKRLDTPCTVDVLRADLRTARRHLEADQIARPLQPTAAGVERLELRFRQAREVPGDELEKEAVLVLDLRVEGRDERWELALSAPPTPD